MHLGVRFRPGVPRGAPALVVVVVCALSAASAWGQAPSTPAAPLEVPAANDIALTLPAEQLVLPNGLTVLLAPDPHARETSVMVKYGVGAADDPDGLHGLAHLTEHLVLQRTKHVERALRELEAAGAVAFSGLTSLDTTTYGETLPAGRLETGLWIESDRMGFASEAVTEERVLAEQAAVSNESREHDLAWPLGRAQAIAMRELFPPWHPYSVPFSAGDDIAGIHVADVRAFLRTWYQPGNAKLAIAGNFERDPALALVTRYFGTLPSVPPPARPALPEWTNPNTWLRVAASTPHDRITVYWRTPEAGTVDDSALDIVAAALAGPHDDRLRPALIEEHLATRVTARQLSLKRGSIFTINIEVAPAADLQRIIDLVRNTMTAFGDTVTESEVARARVISENTRLVGLESPRGRAGYLLRTGPEAPVGPGFRWCLDQYEAIHASDVAHAAKTWLTPSRRVVTVILANASFPASGVVLDRTVMSP